MMRAPKLTEFRLHDRVRLLRGHGDVQAGARGRILGRYAREADPTYCVSFDSKQVCTDIRFDELALVPRLAA